MPMALDPFGEERPRPKSSMHEIGQDLSALSVHELSERIAMLEAEIRRLEEARRGKEASKAAADAFFKG